MSGDTKRVLEVNQIDNLQGSTQRVKQETTLNNLRGITQRVYVVGGGSAPVIDELNVTPSTSAQTITAPEGVDGYSLVNVSAVDSTIDANIQPGNIKDGVEILGVTGTCVELNGETKTITPQTYGQTIYPTNPKNGITEISVNAVTSSIDANIVAGNIKKDVQILGVTGTYTGGGTAPAYYIEKTATNGQLNRGSTIINLSGITDIGDYALYCAYYGNANISGAIDLSSLTTVSGGYAFYQAFKNCTNITSVNLSSLVTVTGSRAFSDCFHSITGLTSIDISSLASVTGEYGCGGMFNGDKNVTSIDLSSLTTINATNACYYMFNGCTGLASVNIGSLTQITGSSAAEYMFSGAIITSINFSSLTTISGNKACASMFKGCKQLVNVNLPVLNTINDNNTLQQMFRDCTSLTSLSFPALTSNSFSSQSPFNGMLQGVTGCTVHFPSNLQSVIGSWADVTAGFGGTNTVLAFDLPATE